MNFVNDAIVDVKTLSTEKAVMEIVGGDPICGPKGEHKHSEIIKCLFCRGSGHTTETILKNDGGIYEVPCPCCGGRGSIRIKCNR